MKMLTVSAFLCAMIALTRASTLGPPIETAKSPMVNMNASCPGRWSKFKGRYFLVVPRPMTWAKAEKNCQSLGGNLASIHNILEYQEIQRLIKRATYQQKEAWVGGSDAQEENQWFWSDGTRFNYMNWCPGEPSNYQYNQHCMQINFGAQKCWDDVECCAQIPSVCAKKIKKN